MGWLIPKHLLAVSLGKTHLLSTFSGVLGGLERGCTKGTGDSGDRYCLIAEVLSVDRLRRGELTAAGGGSRGSWQQRAGPRHRPAASATLGRDGRELQRSSCQAGNVQKRGQGLWPLRLHVCYPQDSPKRRKAVSRKRGLTLK